MEVLLNSPGLYHIVMKIIPCSNEKKFPETIKNLRLVCRNWREIVESKSTCRLLLRTTRQHGVFSKEVNDMLQNIFKISLEKELKIHWHFSQLMLRNWNARKSAKSHPLEQSAKSQPWDQSVLKILDIKSMLGFGFLSSDTYILITLKEVFVILSDASLEVVKICYESKIIDEFLSTLLSFAINDRGLTEHDAKNFLISTIEDCFAILMKFAIFHSCRPELVKYLIEYLRTNSHNLTDPTGLKFKLRNFVTDIIWVLVYWPNCMNPEMKTKFIEIVDLLMENINRTDILVTMPDANFTLERLKNDLLIKKGFSVKSQQLLKSCRSVGPRFPWDVHNPFLMVLYNDKNQNYVEVIKIFAKVLKNNEHPITENVLETINFYAAMKGYAEVMKIVAEKIGKKYVNFAMRIMKNFVHGLDQEVLEFLAKIIDDQDRFQMPKP